MLSTVGRIVAVSFAFLMAIAVAGFIAFRLGLEWMTRAQHADAQPILSMFDWIFQVLMTGQLMLTIALIPLLIALAVVVTGEVARIRSALYYIGGGGLAVSVIPLLLKGSALNWQVFATAGFAGGAIYWLFAGRRA